MQSPLELRHLRTLLALADTGSVSRAAQRVSLTQSALSHQLKALEDHYGTALFERKTLPLKLTAAGKRLISLAETVLPAVGAAERDLARIAFGEAGQLRIAVECHTCFDWLMPAMDCYRERWPEVELDIVSGFHADPIGLLHEDRADLAIVSERDEAEAVRYFPLFSYEVVALLAHGHPLAAKPYLSAEDFAAETLISYPVPDDMLDLIRQVLRPAGIQPKRRTSELTIAILQLVASRRGIAALPQWAVQPYLDRGYVEARPITTDRLYAQLYAATLPTRAGLPYVEDFVDVMRETSQLNLPGIVLLAE
ncbi:LysR family transcriptional regulator [Parachitinimonas caeni]|uniref:HTH-type transcriptional regulator MetR n=1 Tax=Parachitinimonas caeni TaxID=3031301 RepID=A0ABT7DSR1_9NEIS|nr:LysR family transcriptional regulator [Parachitinimonas caeni]MDK2123106.1 LysR family transcriptional regulator [Parachitinimonas caeni]